jgi:hypothetical protein
MSQNYFIDPKKGIYYMQSAYGDEVEYVYIVDFDQPNVEEQFKHFLRYVEKEGASKKMAELKKQFSVMRELFF